MGIINFKTTQILIDPPRVFSFLRFNRNHDAAQIFISNQSMYFIYIIIIIIHSSINVYHFANLYVYIFSTTLNYIIVCTDPFCCYKKNRKKYYCYWISYNNVINESYIFVYINCVKLRDQTKYSVLCILRECIISTK